MKNADDDNFPLFHTEYDGRAAFEADRSNSSAKVIAPGATMGE